jgi:hypothetical protein
MEQSKLYGPIGSVSFSKQFGQGLAEAATESGISGRCGKTAIRPAFPF